MRLSGSFIRLKLFLAAVLLSTVSCVIRSNPVYYTAGSNYHIVKPGESLSMIGQKYDLSVQNLKLFNDLKSDKIFPGQKLYLIPRLRQKREYVTVRPIPPSGFHLVRSREKITTIAKMYDVSLLELINLNHLGSFDLTAGQKIYLQGETYNDVAFETDHQKEKQKYPDKETEEEITIKPPEKEKLTQALKNNFNSNPVIPLKGKISSEFGLRNGKPHKGIDISAEMGTPILATLPGEVAYVGNQRGYGNVIILEHDNYIMTVYAHNEANLVREGDKVSSGQPIATVGNSGTTTGPHLHFEYRVKGVARNPRELLPGF
jgi:murein DD-endopeptidase MepM/ murein hydrolase activator NlpD